MYHDRCLSALYMVYSLQTQLGHAPSPSPAVPPPSPRFQHQVLLRNPTVTEGNKHHLVETFRSIAEILIWGDQNDSRVFE